MRYIAKYRRYTFKARDHVEMNLANGKSQVMQYGVVCEFNHGGLFNHEKELAKQNFKFKGTLQEMDEATPIDPVYGVNNRLSVFDTDDEGLVARWAQWDKLEGNPEGTIKREVEERLANSSEFGADYILVEAVRVAPPYDKYVVHRKVQGRRTLEHAIKDITAAFELAGFDVAQAVAYEQQENGPAELVAALEALVKVDDPTEELVAA